MPTLGLLLTSLSTTYIVNDNIGIMISHSQPEPGLPGGPCTYVYNKFWLCNYVCSHPIPQDDRQWPV